MASKAINQNDLIDIIKANVEVVTDTLNIIKNSNIKSTYTSVNAFKSDAKMIFQCMEYITGLIIKNSRTLLDLAKAKHIAMGYKNLHESLVYIKDINDLFITYKDAKKTKEIFADIVTITDSLLQISKNIALMVLYLPLFSSFVASSPIIFSTFGIALQMIGKLTEVAKFTITRFITIKLFSMAARTMVKGFKTVLAIIKGVTEEISGVHINPVRMLQILWCVNILSDIISVMKSIHGFFLVRRMKMVRLAMVQIVRTLSMIAKARNISKATKNIFLYKIAIDSLFGLMLSLTIMAPIALLFVTISPVILVCMYALAKVLDIIGFIARKTLTKKSTKGLKNLSVAILGITAIALTLIVLSKISWTVVAGLPGVILLLAGLIVVAFLTKQIMAIVNKFSSKRTTRRLVMFEATLLILTAIAGTVMVLSAVATLALIGMPNLILFMFGLLIVSASIWVLLKIVKHLTTLKIIGGLLILAGLIASMLGIGYLLIALGSVALIVHANFLNILLFIGELVIIALTIGVLGFVVASLGAYTVFIIAGLALLTVVIGMVFIMGKMLIEIQNMKLNKKMLKENIKTILDSTYIIIDALFNSKETDNNPSDKGWIPSVLGKFMKGSADIMMAIMSVGYLALSLVSISLLLLMAHELRAVQDIELDSSSIGNKVSAVIGATKTIIDTIFQRDTKETPKSNKGFLSDLIGSVFPDFKPIMQAIMSVGFLAISLASVGMVGMLANHLTSIQKLPSMAGIENKVATVVKAAKTVIDSIFSDNNNGIGKLLKQIADSKKASLMLRSLLGTVEATNNCGLELVKIGNLDIAAITRSSLVTDSIIDSINRISELDINTEGMMGKTRIIRDLNSIIKDVSSLTDKEVENNTKVLNNYVKFVDKVNAVKLDNLSKATSMFKEMARLSESINGNFEGLADSLNEKIAPLLEELRDMLTKIPDNIQDSSKNISQTIVNNADGSKGWTPSIIQQNMKNFDNTPNLSDLQEEQTKASYESKADNMRISELLEEILDVMTGSGAYPDGVKTS